MANLTKAAMRDRILEHLGIKGAGQSAASEDELLVSEAIDSAWYRLRAKGLVPFDTSAIPEWAQTPFRDYVAGDVADVFGLQGQRLQSIMERQRMSLKAMSHYVKPERPPMPTQTKYF